MSFIRKHKVTKSLRTWYNIPREKYIHTICCTVRKLDLARKCVNNVTAGRNRRFFPGLAFPNFQASLTCLLITSGNCKGAISSSWMSRSEPVSEEFKKKVNWNGIIVLYLKVSRRLYPSVSNFDKIRFVHIVSRMLEII